MHLILLGPPGVGKGTQAKLICQQHHLVHLSSGDMLRAAVQAQSRLGLEVRASMEAGKLVPDHLIINLVKERLMQEECRSGWLLDGFPRTLAQAAALTEAAITIDHVIVLTMPDDSLIARLSGRRVHLPSGRTYHICHRPPQVAGRDDITGELLTQRPDDEERIIRQRLLIYHQQTAPLIAYYRQHASQGVCRYAEVAADKSVAEVNAAVSQSLAYHQPSNNVEVEVASTEHA